MTTHNYYGPLTMENAEGTPSPRDAAMHAHVSGPKEEQHHASPYNKLQTANVRRSPGMGSSGPV